MFSTWWMPLLLSVSLLWRLLLCLHFCWLFCPGMWTSLSLPVALLSMWWRWDDVIIFLLLMSSPSCVDTVFSISKEILNWLCCQRRIVYCFYSSTYHLYLYKVSIVAVDPSATSTARDWPTQSTNEWPLQGVASTHCSGSLDNDPKVNVEVGLPWLRWTSPSAREARLPGGGQSWPGHTQQLHWTQVWLLSGTGEWPLLTQ